MKINVKNSAKISAVLDELQKRARERTISADYVQFVAIEAEKRLAKNELAKYQRTGARVIYGYHEFRSGYKYTAYGTIIVLERFAAGWFLIDVKRDNCMYGRNSIIYNDKQRKIIAEKAIASASRF